MPAITATAAAFQTRVEQIIVATILAAIAKQLLHRFHIGTVHGARGHQICQMHVECTEMVRLHVVEVVRPPHLRIQPAHVLRDIPAHIQIVSRLLQLQAVLRASVVYAGLAAMRVVR